MPNPNRPETPGVIGPWPFPDDPPDAEAIALGRILDGSTSILLVTRDGDDGTWQFLDGGHVFEEDAVLVLLGEMLQFAPSIAELADLPLGWHARRESALGVWKWIEGEPMAKRED